MSSPTAARIGHNSTILDTALIVAIKGLRCANQESISHSQEGRTRRDAVLTKVALQLAEMLGEGDWSKARLQQLANALGEKVSGHNMRKPAACLARLVCGAGRTRNTYSHLGIAGGALSLIPAGGREEYLERSGGVSGLALKVGDASEASDPVPTKPAAAERILCKPGLTAALGAGERRIVRALIEIGGGDEPVLLAGPVRGRVRLSVPAGSTLSVLEHRRLGLGDGLVAGGEDLWVPVSDSVLAVIADGAVVVQAFSAGDGDASGET